MPENWQLGAVTDQDRATFAGLVKSPEFWRRPKAEQVKAFGQIPMFKGAPETLLERLVDGAPPEIKALGQQPAPAAVAASTRPAAPGAGTKLWEGATVPIAKSLTGRSITERVAGTRDSYVSGAGGKLLTDAAEMNRRIQKSSPFLGSDPDTTAALNANATPGGRSLNHKIVTEAVNTGESMYGTPLGLVTVGAGGMLKRGIEAGKKAGPIIAGACGSPVSARNWRRLGSPRIR